MKNIVIFSTLILSLSVIQSCTDSEGKGKMRLVRSEKIPVRLLPVIKSPIKTVIHGSGQFTTDDETILSFKTGGIVEQVFVKEGDRLKKGQLLATLNMTEIDAMVSQAKLGYEKAIRDMNRVSNLYRDSVATLEQFQNAQTAVEVATQHYDAAKFNRSYSEIRALQDGYVLRKFTNVGQMVEPGSPVFQTNGAGKGAWKVRLGVSDHEWARIAIGDSASISSDATTRVVSGFVSRKSEGTDLSTGTFLIEVTLSEAVPEKIASGMFARVSITPAVSVDGWSIPYDAVLDGDKNAGFVFTTNDGETVHKTPVEISALGKDYITVSKGLENAKHVVVAGSAYLRDNSPITVID